MEKEEERSEEGERARMVYEKDLDWPEGRLEGKGMEKEEPVWTGVGASGSELEIVRELEGWWETETEMEEPGKYEEALVEMERAAPEEERSLERAESTERRPWPQEFWLLRRVQKVPAGNFLVEDRRVSAIA